MVTKPWTPAPVAAPLDDIEVPLPPVTPEEPVLKPKEGEETEVPEVQPTPLPLYTEEEIAGLITAQADEQHAKDQAVALAAAVQQMQSELVEIRARLAQLEGAA